MPSKSKSKKKKGGFKAMARVKAKAKAIKRRAVEEKGEEESIANVRRKKYSKAVRAAILASAAARQKLIEMGGENTIDVIREFDYDMCDDELAKKIGIKPSEVRVVLNRLHTRGIFSYTRVRDKDSGWYSYIWRLHEERLKDVGCEQAGAGEECRISEGYCCPACNDERVLDLKEALEIYFKCERCGRTLEFFNLKKGF